MITICCPLCNTEYLHAMSEFCLEDGTRLISIAVTTIKTETISVSQIDKANFSTDKNV